jgi:hypothetical protein
MTEPRNWDREMADIDKAIAKNTLPAGSPPAPTSRASVPVGAPVRRRSVALTWFWVLLALALAAALPLWPYERSCGLRLTFFLGAAGVTGLIGLLGALASWSHRRGLAHVLSLLVIVWAAVVGLREILPRVGYARVARTWTCEVVPAQPAGPERTAPSAAPGTAPRSAPGAAPSTAPSTGTAPTGFVPQ